MDAHSPRVEEALADPTRQFKTPMEVVEDSALDSDEKRLILESWKKDAELLATAQNENMTGGERPQLQDVSLALSKLEQITGMKIDRSACCGPLVSPHSADWRANTDR